MKFIPLLLSMLFVMPSCSNIPTRPMPIHNGVDPKVEKVLDEYMYLSAQKHIQFYNKVTIGLRDIDYKSVIGVCYYGAFFREIDIDKTYWNMSTYSGKMALLFHELSHCYCGRGHDFGNKQKYPDNELKREALSFAHLFGRDLPGYFPDDCPMSLMHPTVVSDSCLRAHYAEYTEEMFNGCSPY